MSISFQVINMLVIAILQKNFAEDTIKKPMPVVYGKFQFAGNVGLASAGAGIYLFRNAASLDLSYGYLPGTHGTEISTFALKPSIYLFKKDYPPFSVDGYTGITATYSIAKNTYIKYPGHFPENYYLANAFHFNPFVGIRLHPFRDHSASSAAIYAELGSVDYKIIYAIKNKCIHAADILNFCFGFSFPILNK